MNLKQLFHPVSVSEVRDAANRNELIHYSRGAESIRDSIMNWEIATHIAERQGAVPGVLRVLRDGVNVKPEMLRTSRGSERLSGAALRRLVRQGVSFVASDIEEFGPALRSLALDAERHFGCHAALGLIATFGSGCALKPHWDPQDVICIQVAGRKTWKILGRPFQGRIRSRDQADVPGEITREVAMEPGDLMIVPRGYWHCCQSEEDNLQFSILLHRQIGGDFIEGLAKKALEEPLFHRAIPLSRDPAELAALEAEWLARFRELAAPGCLSRYLDSADRVPEIPFCFDRFPADPCDPEAVLSLATRRPIAPPAASGEPWRMGGVMLQTTPALLAVVDIVNREISAPASELFDSLAPPFTRDEIAEAMLALDESCLARLHKRDC
jgi:hypothetical protein